MTGQTKSEILEEIKNFTLENRKSFETFVNKSNIFTPQHSEEEYNILETLNRIQNSNDLLKNDTEFITFMNEFTTYINTNKTSNEQTLSQNKRILWGKLSNINIK